MKALPLPVQVQVLTLTVALLLAVVAPIPVSAQTTPADPHAALSVVRAYHAALAAKDAGAVEALLDESFELNGTTCCWGKARMVEFHRYQFRQSVHTAFDGYTVQGNSVTYRARAALEQDWQQGIPPLEGNYTAVVEGGRIITLTADFDPASTARREAALAARATQTAQLWASRTPQAVTRTEAAAAAGPKTQSRSVASPAVLLAFCLLLLLGVAGLAMRKQPKSQS